MNLPVFSTIRQVIVNPRQFYTGMPQEGGVIQPSLFVVAVALLSAVLLALLELFTQGLGSALSVLLQSIVVLPVYSLLACLLLTIGFQLLWKILQTPQGFEVAFRCVAYSFAVFPLWVLLKEQHILPQVLLLVLWAVILSAATETVHAVNTMKSRVVFVVLVVLAWAFMLCNCGDNNADQASVMVKAETTAEELSVVVVESSDTSIGGLELAVEKTRGRLLSLV